MIVYVCWEDYGYDGSSKPLAVFDNPKQAKDWCAQRIFRAYFERLELNNIAGWSE